MAEDYGLKISVEGVSVFSATDIQTAFKNDSSLLKVVQSGTGTFGVSGIVTVTHSLGYVPQFLVFQEVAYDFGNGDVSIVSTGDVYDQAIAGADTTTLKLLGNNGKSYQYYIFYESVDGTSHSATVSSNNYGIKVMKPGYAITSTDLENQSLNSEKNNLKIALTGTLSVTSGGAGDTGEIAHGLSYTPGFILWSQVNNEGKWYFGNSGGWYSSGVYASYVDSVNLSYYHNAPAGQNLKIYYVLFVENSV